MGDQRQPFRFRLPWLSAADTSRPAPEPKPRPATKTQPLPQSTTPIPIHRLPFRPAVVAPVQTTSAEVHALPQKTEPQQPGVSGADTEPKATSVAPVIIPVQAQALTQKTEPQPPVVSGAATEPKATSLAPVLTQKTEPQAPAVSGAATEPKATSLAPLQTVPTQAQARPQKTEPQPPIASGAVAVPKGISLAPVQTTATQAHAPPQKTEPQPPTISDVVTEPKATSLATVQTAPTQAQAPPLKAETQPPTVSGATTEPKATSLLASPSRKTKHIRSSSVPPSPTRTATEAQVTSRPVSPLRATIQTQTTSQARSPSYAPIQASAASMSPSPPRIAPPLQLTEQVVSEQQSPTRMVNQPADQKSSRPSSPSRRVTQVQTVSSPKRSAMATEVGSQPPSSTPSLLFASREPTFKPFGVAVKPSETTVQPKQAAAITAMAEKKPSAPLKPKEIEDRKKAAEGRRKATTKDSTREEPDQRSITTKLLAAATETGTKTRELLGADWEAGKRHKEKKEDVEKKKSWATSSTGEKQIKMVSSAYPKDRSMQNNSHQKHVASDGEQVPLYKEIREDISKFVHKLTTGQPKLPTDEKSIGVLTLTGENRGAYFHASSESTKRVGLVHIIQGKKTNPDDSRDATGEGSSKGRKPKDSTTKENLAPSVYVNSNAQTINNSILFENSLNERNPGVHLDFLHNLAEPTKSSAKAEMLEPQGRVTPAEKLTYEPSVERRGLFEESSDSDPENP